MPQATACNAERDTDVVTVRGTPLRMRVAGLLLDEEDHMPLYRLSCTALWVVAAAVGLP